MNYFCMWIYEQVMSHHSSLRDTPVYLSGLYVCSDELNIAQVTSVEVSEVPTIHVCTCHLWWNSTV